MPYMVVVSEWGVERDCRKDVRDAGFTTYQPVARERLIKHGRKMWVERLLFGRYFFVKHEPDKDWRPLVDLRRVNCVLGQCDDALKPALVPDYEIAAIRDCEDKSGFVVTGKGVEKFRKGQKVYATTGVMIGIEGEYVGIGRGGCEVALLDLFGHKSRVEFRPGVLAA